MPTIYDVTRIYEPIDVHLEPGEEKTISLGYTPAQWTIYSYTAAWRAGWINAMPGSAALSERVFKLLPNMRMTIPARGPELSLRNLAALKLVPFEIVCGEDLSPKIGIGGYNVLPDSPDIWAATSILTANPWLLHRLSVYHVDLYGSPVGTVTWEVREDNSDFPGSVLLDGAYTPVLNSWNELSMASDTQLPAGVCWMGFRPTQEQTGWNGWYIARTSYGPYEDGYLRSTINGWSAPGGGYLPWQDLSIKVEGEYFEQLLPIDLVVEVA